MALGRGVRAWGRALLQRLGRDADLRTAVAYVLVGAALRADFIWLGDQMNTLWRAATLALVAGFLEDIGVALLVLALVPRGRRLSALRAGLFAFGVFLTVLNLRTLAALNVPFDPLMLTYVSEPLHTNEIQSPIPLAVLGVHLTLAWGALFAARKLGFAADALAPPRARRRARVLEVLGAVALIFGSRALSHLDYRATQVSHADGFSWLSFQLDRHAFGLPAGTDPRRALLTPAATAGDEFVDERFPLVRGTPYALCKAGLGGDRCNRDEDGDGVPLRDDCDDRNAQIHPGALDVPGDGVDQDCSGLDAGAPDVLVLELEGLPSHVLAATGGHGVDLVMPELDALTRRTDARLFTHYETAAGQTAPGFASAMCSLLPHYGSMITRAYGGIGMRCLPEILAEHGYEARMVQNGDPNFDNQRVFAEHAGFSTIEGARDIELAIGGVQRVTKWGVVDAGLFHRLRDLFAGRTPEDPPLFVLAQSISNHYPYALPDARFARPGPGGATWQKARSTSAYVDDALGGLV
ncbi:MAG TPA: sulfatase-like hydrolase/transferase, partial [Polyangiaceae bacterium]|nr:sulfatase-like hydrolase/transferase [Polyangiaceae bacterium]